jgi:hypothetical protein
MVGGVNDVYDRGRVGKVTSPIWSDGIKRSEERCMERTTYRILD